MKRWWTSLLSLALATTLAGCAAPAHRGADAAEAGPLILERQGSFFVGGRTVQSGDLSLLPAYAPSGRIAVEQMYVRYQVPPAAARPPVVLIHGCCLTGKTWETTPDGRSCGTRCW